MDPLRRFGLTGPAVLRLGRFWGREIRGGYGGEFATLGGEDMMVEQEPCAKVDST